MTLEQVVLARLRTLPPATQQEVLNFVEFLASRQPQAQPADLSTHPGLLHQLRTAGFIAIATTAPANALSDQALEAFVKTLPPTPIPTSQIIIEERGEW
jgi:hypothetical protein